MIEIKIAETLKRVGVPTSLLGSSYLRYAIKLVFEICNQARFERAIRHAVEVAWDRGDATFLAEIFGCTVSAEKGKPTNREFISAIVDWIEIDLRIKAFSNIVAEGLPEGEADA